MMSLKKSPATRRASQIKQIQQLEGSKKRIAHLRLGVRVYVLWDLPGVEGQPQLCAGARRARGAK